MTEDKDEKPVTLADYIPPEPAPDAKRRRVSKADRDKLERIERAVRETEPDAVRRSKGKDRSGRDLEDYYENKGWKARKGKRKRGAGRLIFWAVIIMLIIVFVLD